MLRCNVFQWISNIVNPFDCNGESITVYDLTNYSFVFIETANGGTLYFEDGTLYCTNFPGFDCLSFYGLNNNNISTVWQCNQSSSPDAFVDAPVCTAVYYSSFCAAGNLVCTAVYDFILFSRQLGLHDSPRFHCCPAGSCCRCPGARQCAFSQAFIFN